MEPKSGHLINVYQQPLCVDDYGNEVWECHWSKRLVTADQAVLTGSFLPGAHWKFVAAPGFEEARRQSYIAFADSEANCNTCRHLERLPSRKTADGLLKGRCKAIPIKHPYPIRDGVITFPPDDCMLMECYESRWGD